MTVELDRNLAHSADVIQASLQVDVQSMPAAGAARFMGGQMLACVTAEQRVGVDIVREVLGLLQQIPECSHWVTGGGGGGGERGGEEGGGGGVGGGWGKMVKWSATWALSLVRIAWGVMRRRRGYTSGR
ncbi:glycerate kinase [Klebsiella pneumoniae]|uniref:glycerate kinase n=1 Tax=Klebsiella pneumoniae TaxID=573 RepID=UPI0024084784|nr:glycerate kinase [Klebsiella pneumoniae]